MLKLAGFLSFEHRFKEGVHFFLFDKVAPLGRRYSFFHGCKETSLFVEVTGSNIRHQRFGGGRGFGGKLNKLRLLLGVKCTSMLFRPREVRLRETLLNEELSRRARPR